MIEEEMKQWVGNLSVTDENKVIIGSSGAIPPLVSLLSNKGKALRAGIIPTLMRLLKEPEGAMVDEALTILAILASHFEGKAAIGSAKAVPLLVEFIGSGSPRNKENAATVPFLLLISMTTELFCLHFCSFCVFFPF
ncbi:hypothetical protein TanjilG_03297 [Lupinus angustifolius]|uniref:U-box domain-containing protein n=1 Tax=Lupinus angustifolius TaxID=3871 RepID=A0A4P1RD88_LUPAN|nr:hypothetical protein TanjilG_03297 [Lupinus angustifolius]